MSDDRLIELISRKFSGEATADELEEFDTLLLIDADAADRYKQLQQYWDEHDNANQQYVEEAFNKIFPAINSSVEETQSSEKKPRRNFFLRVAAAASILLTAGSVFYFSTDLRNYLATAGENRLLEKKNSKGVKGSLTLSDGTKIWMNADTKLRYPETFDGNTREVYLSGEAFFEVAKNTAKPFIIHLANGTVKVVGTSFNIRAYDNEKVVEASVATGKVAFIPKYSTTKKTDTVFLTADKKLRFVLGNDQAIVAPTRSNEDRAWIGGKLTYKGMTFEDIGFDLERNFGKPLVFMTDEVRDFKLTGSFQNNSLEEILFYLSKTKEFNYKITDVEVLISNDSTNIPD